MKCPHCGHGDLLGYFRLIWRDRDDAETRCCPICGGRFIVQGRAVIDLRHGHVPKPPSH
jgi:DNA-directed RNA polymerase subunit RPC12/RpoP